MSAVRRPPGVVHGRVRAADCVRIPEDHEVEWLRGCQTIEVAGKSIEATIGAEVVILPAAVVADALWMAKLARGSSWPNEMAQRVDDAADRVIRALGGQS